MDPIPAVWRIDVEPNEFQIGSDRPLWTGFPAMASLVGNLRGRLEDRTGAPLCVSWFPRFDPEIARSYGHVNFVFDRYAGVFHDLQAAGDVFGIHVHYYRWDRQRQVTFSDHANLEWVKYCVDVSAKAFERCFEEPVRRVSQGGFFLHEAVVERAVALGIEVDVTPEPGLGALHEDASFGAYVTAPSPDFRDFPRHPYYPALADLRVPAATLDAARPLMLVPLSAYDYDTALAPWARRLARKLRSGSGRHCPLNPWKKWPHPRVYWDLMERAADEGPARYIAFAVRTVSPSSGGYRQAQALFEYLPHHPIARRLRFVDPLSPVIRAMASAGMSAEPAS